MIEVANLTKNFAPHGAKAVDAASFKIDRGRVGCLIGTSGCGKTTTLKMINRLVEPTSGAVVVDGRDARSCEPVRWRRGIGYVVQGAGLLPHLSVGQNISLLSRILGRDRDFIEGRLRRLMDTIGMSYDKFHGRFPAELSGGQRQRVGIARALMEEPPVLLMDEPFGALDPITRAGLHEELIRLNKQLRKTILMVTHDIDEALKLGDTIILMHGGKIVQAGSARELTEEPADDFVADFVGGKIHG